MSNLKNYLTTLRWELFISVIGSGGGFVERRATCVLPNLTIFRMSLFSFLTVSTQ